MKGKYNKVIKIVLVLCLIPLLVSCSNTNVSASELKVETNEVLITPIIGELPVINVTCNTLVKEPKERKIDPSKKMVCLTFDDGPSKKNTKNIVDLLIKYDMRASFFEVGNIAVSNPDLVLYEYEAGNEICNHSYSHLNMKKSSYDEVINEISKTNEILKNITGEDVIYVRPPYGSVNKDALKDSNMCSILWSVDTRDWESRNKDKIMDVIKSEETLDGAVILMHSSHQETVEALKLLLPYLEENGYQTVTISEMFKYRYGEIPEAGKIYNYTYFIKQRSKNPGN